MLRRDRPQAVLGKIYSEKGVAYLPGEYGVERAQDVVGSTEPHVLMEAVGPFHGSGVPVLLLQVAEKELGKAGSLPCLRMRSEYLP